MNKEALEICLGFDSRGLYALYFGSPVEYPRSPTKSIEMPLSSFKESELIIRLAKAISRERFSNFGKVSYENIRDFQNKQPLTDKQKHLFIRVYNNMSSTNRE